MDRHAEGDRPDLGDLGVEVLGQVALVEHDHGLRAALPAGGEIPLDAADVEVVAEGAHEEHHVDVGRHDLLDALVAGGLAQEHRVALEDGVDGRGVGVRAVGNRNPVADGWEVGGARGVMAKPARDLGRPLTARGIDHIGAAVLRGDARRRERVGGVQLEFSFTARAPPERGQIMGQPETPSFMAWALDADNRGLEQAFRRLGC